MKTLGASLVAAMIGVAALWYATDGWQALTGEGARRIAIVRDKPAVPDITLETMIGTRQLLRAANGKVVVAEFIYTTCPTICRTGGAYLARLRDALVAQGLDDKVQVISISFDPQTDRREELAQYGKFHDADGTVWTVARPSASDLPELLQAFGVVVIPDAFGGYQHNAAMHIVSPEGRLTSIVDSDDVDGALLEARRVLQ